VSLLFGCGSDADPAGPQLSAAADLAHSSRLAIYGLSGSDRPPGACTVGPYRQFDFWVGDWDISVPSGLVPTSHVRSLVGGCLVEENFFGVGGAFGGRSMNVYDRTRALWRQMWMDDTSALILLEGERKGAAMQLTGSRLARVPSGNILATDDTVTWTDRDSGPHQFWLSVFRAGSQTFPITLFDGSYQKNPLAAEPPIASSGACEAGRYRDLDYWVGSWEVRRKNRVVGNSTVRMDLGGCLIEETFAARRYENQSFIAYDGLEDRWVRSFVDSNGTTLLLEGRFVDGVLLLTGTTRLGERDAQVRMRIRQETASVLVQTWEVSFDGERWLEHGRVSYHRK